MTSSNSTRWHLPFATKRVCLFLNNESNIDDILDSVVGRKIASNQPMHRPWGIDVDFACLEAGCKGQAWDLVWYDKGNHRQKRQRCNKCNTFTDWVSFHDIEGLYSNRLFPTSFPDVYWTPWPLPEETAALFYIKASLQRKGAVSKRKGQLVGVEANITKKAKVV